jgi:hypothetical protein
MKKILVPFMWFLCTTICFGHKLFDYYLDKDGGAHISVKHTKEMGIRGELVIPEYVDGHKVVDFRIKGLYITSVVLPSHISEIPEHAFVGCYNLSKIDIPNSVVKINEFAFYNCKRLEEVIIPNSVEVIGESAFQECTSLTHIVIPNSVKKIGDSAFGGCANLEKIKVPDEANCGSSIFSGCNKLLQVEGYDIKIPFWIDSQIDFTHPIRKYLDNSFSFFAVPKLTSYISEWQKKGRFETVAQWKERVTEQKRKEKAEEYITQLQQEFFKNRGRATCVSVNLVEYDADNQVYKIHWGDNSSFSKVNFEGKEMFIKVPLKDALSFEQNWKPSSIKPIFGIVNDKLDIMSCTIEDEKTNKVYKSIEDYKNDAVTDYALNLPPLEMNFGEVQANPTPNNIPQDNSIDTNFPETSVVNSNTFAVIIGNENYTKVSKVQFAKNDARSFAEYCKKTLGIPEKNVRGYEDATYGTLVSAVGDIQKIVRAYNGDVNVIFYYAGHGIPDNVSKDAYILPIDEDGREMGICYPLSKLYQQLGEMNAKSVTVFLDACFSGATRGEGMLASARGVAIKAKPSAPQGNMVVFSAATDEQTAFPYAEKGHGMFTYFLLKKLRDTKGDVTLGELGEFIKQEVAKHAIVVNGREQTPTINCSQSFSDKWRENKLK